MKHNIIVAKASAFAVRVVNLQRYLVREKKEFILSSQVCKSGTSIGANFAEAQCAKSTADFVSKMKIALKEANETQYWLQLLHNTGYISEKEYTSIYCDLLEILKILMAICKNYPQK